MTKHSYILGEEQRTAPMCSYSASVTLQRGDYRKRVGKFLIKYQMRGKVFENRRASKPARINLEFYELRRMFFLFLILNKLNGQNQSYVTSEKGTRH